MNYPRKIKHFLILSLVLPIIFLVPYAIKGFSYNDVPDIISRIGALAIIVFCVYTILCLFTKNKITNTLLITSGIICLLSIITIFFYILGYLQDIMGYRCVGFFSTTLSCFEKNQFTSSIILLHPITLVAVGVLSIIATYIQATAKK